MHYQPSKRLEEPERLAAPAEAVPVTGGRPNYTYEQAAGLPNPIVRDAESLERARRIYNVNCAMCHGADGRGQSLMAGYYAQAGFEPPTDFASERVRERTDGQLYWIITNGLGNMPAFRALLSERDVWTVVHFIREVQGTS
jgi:mono/diheme cytochrome c family protein